MSWLFIGPRLLAGIGQVTKRYADLLDGEYVEMGHSPQKQRYARGFAFMLPFENNVQLVDQYATICDHMMYMTICETEPVNEAYGMLTKYNVMYVASDFCKRVFEKQFPSVDWRVLHLYAEAPMGYIPKMPTRSTYVFYTIGNISDPRKNINFLLNSFLELKLQDCRLLLKATCNSDVKLEIPGVTVINGLLSNEQMEKIHDAGDCYINCSHSEGVGMGAVEAALRSKPVIITDYGGLKEYVDTPWVVTCTKGPIGFDDFLFKKDHEWGHPSYDDLKKYMQSCYDQKVRTWNHQFTKNLMAGVKPCLQSGQL